MTRPSGERIMPGGWGQGGPGGGGVFAGGVLAFLSGVTSRGGRGREEGAASLTWVRGAQVAAPATR